MVGIMQLSIFLVDSLDGIEEKLLSDIRRNKISMSIETLSLDELNRFNGATRGEICHVKFDAKDRLKCKNMDHEQYMQKCEYASCTMCNLLNKSQNYIPTNFNNFCSYDSKLLLNVYTENLE